MKDLIPKQLDENHLCPSCGKKWKCKQDHEMTEYYMCSRCFNKANHEHKPITKFGEKN